MTPEERASRRRSRAWPTPEQKAAKREGGSELAQTLRLKDRVYRHDEVRGLTRSPEAMKMVYRLEDLLYRLEGRPDDRRAGREARMLFRKVAREARTAAEVQGRTA